MVVVAAAGSLVIRSNRLPPEGQEGGEEENPVRLTMSRTEPNFEEDGLRRSTAFLEVDILIE